MAAPSPAITQTGSIAPSGNTTSKPAPDTAISQAPPALLSSVTSPASPDAASLLPAHALKVLKAQGYDDVTSATVAALMSKNTVTAQLNLPSNAQIASASTELVEGLTSQKLSVNSNEPVFLIEAHSAAITSVSDLQTVKHGVLEYLRKQGIKPVRVYTSITQVDGRPSLAASVLNVTNTNIGGPSMIQLLDAAFHGGDWSQHLTSKEAYDGQNLLWKDESYPDFLRGRNSSSDETAKGQVDHDRHVEIVKDKVAQFPPPPPRVMQEGVDQEDHISDQQVHDQVSDFPSKPVGSAAQPPNPANPVSESASKPSTAADLTSSQHPAMAELTQKESSRPDIKYPERSAAHDSESYIDLITSQSGGRGGSSQPLSVIGGASVQPKAASQPGAQGEDDFEVVDKP